MFLYAMKVLSIHVVMTTKTIRNGHHAVYNTDQVFLKCGVNSGSFNTSMLVFYVDYLTCILHRCCIIWKMFSFHEYVNELTSLSSQESFLDFNYGYLPVVFVFIMKTIILKTYWFYVFFKNLLISQQLAC